MGRSRRMKLCMVILIAFFSWAAYIWYIQEGQLVEKKRELQAIEGQLQEVKGENQGLTQQISRLNDKNYIAELARKNFFMSKPGEVIFITPDQ